MDSKLKLHPAQALTDRFLGFVKGVHRALRRSPRAKGLLYRLEGQVLSLLERQRDFYTSKNDYPYFRLSLIQGTFEPETVRYLRSRLGPGARVVDVGAHVGYYTRLFSDLVGPEGKVIAFEPEPTNYALLSRNLRRARNVLLLNLAVAHLEGHLDFFVPSKGTRWSRLSLEQGQQVDELLKEKSGGLIHHRVQVRPLGRVLQEHGLGQYPIDLLKIDVEGAEIWVLQSLGELSNQVKEVVCELAPENLRAFGYGVEDLFLSLHGLGFQRYGFLDPVAGEGEPYPLPSRGEWFGMDEALDLLRSLQPWPKGLVINVVAQR
ncbi:MAG: FkbM family methyltransferase [Thermus sp.]